MGFARSPVLARARRIDKYALVPGSEWEDAALAAFADTPHLCNLRTFVLVGSPLTASGIRPFLAN